MFSYFFIFVFYFVTKHATERRTDKLTYVFVGYIINNIGNVWWFMSLRTWTWWMKLVCYFSTVLLFWPEKVYFYMCMIYKWFTTCFIWSILYIDKWPKYQDLVCTQEIIFGLVDKSMQNINNLIFNYVCMWGFDFWLPIKERIKGYYKKYVHILRYIF